MKNKSALSVLSFLAVGCVALDDTEVRTIVAESDDDNFIAAEDLPMNCESMDVLFVVDNSPSMGNNQRALQARVGAFAQKLQSLKTPTGDSLDLNFGVTTTSISKRIINPETFRESTTRGHGGTLANLHCYDEELWKITDDSQLSCLANVGLGGSNIEMPLESIRQVVELENNEANEGFIREDALLATVVVTDEDDCSYSKETILADSHEAFCEFSEPIDYFAGKITKAKNGSNHWASWVIGANSSCDDYEGEFPGDSRLEQLAGLEQNIPTFSSICENDFSSSLDLAFEEIARKCHSFLTVE